MHYHKLANLLLLHYLQTYANINQEDFIHGCNGVMARVGKIWGYSKVKPKKIGIALVTRQVKVTNVRISPSHTKHTQLCFDPSFPNQNSPCYSFIFFLLSFVFGFSFSFFFFFLLIFSPLSFFFHFIFSFIIPCIPTLNRLHISGKPPHLIPSTTIMMKSMHSLFPNVAYNMVFHFRLVMY